jgi:hypothetical protein
MIVPNANDSFSLILTMVIGGDVLDGFLPVFSDLH